MSEKTNIAWTDSTINFWSGCTKVSAGCTNCYAEARDRRQMIEPVSHWGNGAPRLKHKGAVKDALAFNRKPWICDGCGKAWRRDGEVYCDCVNPTFHRRRIFSLSLGDWLDVEVPIEYTAEMLDTIRQCADVTWILCTKRPENFDQRMLSLLQIKSPLVENEDYHEWVFEWRMRGKAPANIILLTSVENQQAADVRIPELLKIPAACHGLSLEPLLGKVEIGKAEIGKLKWLIIGCESGAKRRECKLAWVRSLVEQGKNTGIATFVKQLQDSEGMVCADVKEFPTELQIQQWPEGF